MMWLGYNREGRQVARSHCNETLKNTPSVVFVVRAITSPEENLKAFTDKKFGPPNGEQG